MGVYGKTEEGVDVDCVLYARPSAGAAFSLPPAPDNFSRERKAPQRLRVPVLSRLRPSNLSVHLNQIALQLSMNKNGTLWELLRFCLLLYDQSSKLKAPEAALDAGFLRLVCHDGRSPLDGRATCS